MTRSDVARYAGVSTAVVSYVVNNGPRPVAATTAARVRDAIAVLGYQPNANARALKLGTAGLLGLLVPDTGNPFFAEYALAIEQAATQRGLALLIANSGSDLGVEATLLTDLANRQLDGLIVAGAGGPPVDSTLSGVTAVTPTVFVDTASPVPGYRTVGADKHAGALQAAQHLVEVHGHDNVALLMGRGARHATDERETGWRDALRALDVERGEVAYATFTRHGGYVAGQHLLALRPRPTAVFASSDLLGMGLLRAAHEAGLSIPDDLAIVSFDGTNQAEYCWPPLTTIRQPIQEMAAAAVAAIFDQAAPAHQLFPVSLLARRSCGCSLPDSDLKPDRAGSNPAPPTRHPRKSRKRP
ncbi:LacI family DNA-binding transcriptional regulator [Microlunatus ginsengisoli]|uniref:LacI family DNA-binding transcriptional regulator n=1 Tax=Microlunatus ginsengisoli TaxID=363863 RepID=UPI0031DA39AB